MVSNIEDLQSFGSLMYLYIYQKCIISVYQVFVRYFACYGIGRYALRTPGWVLVRSLADIVRVFLHSAHLHLIL